VQHALGGIRIGVCILMLNALIKLFKNGIKDLYGLLLFALAFIATYFNLLSTIIIVICAAIIGITIKHFTQKGGAQS
jgi:chromate transporter